MLPQATGYNYLNNFVYLNAHVLIDFILVIEGLMPTTAGQITSGRGCANWAGSCCNWVVAGVQVKNCGNFYIYYLQPPPTCSLAYCNEG